MDDWTSAAGRIAGIAERLGLPEVDEGTSYGTPAFKVRGKSFARLKDPQTLVLLLPMELKDLLMEMSPDTYFETDHYRGWPAVLVRLMEIDDAELGQRLAEAWQHKAPKRLAAARQAPDR
ncbi:MAG TPA: MmcQ/YjbR family DNA-binding protein [Devosiaceae bacterium]|jgi:hypothetical protein|nr:MmcQ/YjbR family DNA-binding protein [Devosiaceae bacterium]